MIKISSELASQHISRHAIGDLLYYLERIHWANNCNYHQLTIEAWEVGIWVKEVGIISYKDLAEFIRETSIFKASGLQVQQRSPNLFLVQGSQRPWYTVQRRSRQYICECMLYRCRRKRLRNEFPQLFEALNKKIFCHHIIAAYQSLK